MTAEIVDLAARRLSCRAEAKAEAPDELADWESGRRYMGRMLDAAREQIATDNLPRALLSVEKVARELRWLVERGLMTEAQERQAAIKTKNRMATAEKGAETRARNRAKRPSDA